MEIIEINKEEILKIKELWKELNSYHCERSSYFKFHFKSFTFEKRIEGLLKKEHLVIYAAEIDSVLVGYCIATVIGNLGEIDSIFIKKEHRGKNLGHKLTQKAKIEFFVEEIEKIKKALQNKDYNNLAVAELSKLLEKYETDLDVEIKKIHFFTGKFRSFDLTNLAAYKGEEEIVESLY